VSEPYVAAGMEPQALAVRSTVALQLIHHRQAALKAGPHRGCQVVNGCNTAHNRPSYLARHQQLLIGQSASRGRARSFEHVTMEALFAHANS
jgi:hypothetical protein